MSIINRDSLGIDVILFTKKLKTKFGSEDQEMSSGQRLLARGQENLQFWLYSTLWLAFEERAQLSGLTSGNGSRNRPTRVVGISHSPQFSFPD